MPLYEELRGLLQEVDACTETEEKRDEAEDPKDRLPVANQVEAKHHE